MSTVAPATTRVAWPGLVAPASPRGNTFDRTDWAVLARHWYPVARGTDVAAASVAVTLLDESLVISRTVAGLEVTDDTCGPGDVRTYAAVERYGLVWTCLRPDRSHAAAPETAPIPLMPGWGLPGYQSVTCPPLDVAAGPGRQVEGFLDGAHLGFLSFNGLDEPETPELHETPPDAWTYGFDVQLPFIATLVVHLRGEACLSVMNAASPVSAGRTRMFAPIARNFNTDQPAHNLIRGSRCVFEQDRALVELSTVEQSRSDARLEPRLEATNAATRSSVAYRHALRRLGLSPSLHRLAQPDRVTG
jgi:phenylpropionate dioxygenase-like ring-hydroxylating dioxygenase large terminal subunit